MTVPRVRLLILALGIAAMSLCASAPGFAQTLDAILKSGRLRVGIDMTIPPFGFEDAQNQPAGSEVETARLLAHDLGVTLEIVPTTAANRVPYLLTDRADMMMATFAISTERAKTVWFSTPYGASGAVLIAPKGLQAASFADLVGKSVAVARGSLTDQGLAADAPKGVRIVHFDDDAGAAAAMMQGQVDAYGTATPVATGLLQHFPDRDLAVKFTIRTAWYSIGLRRGDTDMLRWVNTFLFVHLQNGDLARIYQHWTGMPLPPVPTL